MAIASDIKTLSSHYREQALIYAQNGKTDDLRAWIHQHGDLLERFGNKLLRSACKNGHHDCVTLLLEQGIDVNAQNSEGLTAIDAAAHSGHWAIVEDLLKVGANPNGSPRADRHNCSPTPLLCAAKAGNRSIMYHLEEMGASIHYRDSKGQGLVHYAAQAHDHGAETVRMALTMLATPHLSKRELVNMKDKTRETPLHAAARARSVGAIQALIEYGADPQVANVIGQKPEDLTHDTECLQALIPPKQSSLLDGPGR